MWHVTIIYLFLFFLYTDGILGTRSRRLAHIFYKKYQIQIKQVK